MWSVNELSMTMKPRQQTDTFSQQDGGQSLTS